MFLHRFEKDNALCSFVVSFWGIDKSFLWLCCVGCHTFFHIFSFIFSYELSQTSCETVTQGPYNVVLLFPSGHFTLLFSFESLMTHSHSYVVWTVTLLALIFSIELFHSVCVTVTQRRYNFFLMSPSWNSPLLHSF